MNNPRCQFCGREMIPATKRKRRNWLARLFLRKSSGVPIWRCQTCRYDYARVDLTSVNMELR